MADENTLTEIRIALGKIEVSTFNTERRVVNIERDILTFIDDKALEPLRDRLTKLESFQAWAQRAALSAFASLLIATLWASKKLGL